MMVEPQMYELIEAEEGLMQFYKKKPYRRLDVF